MKVLDTRGGQEVFVGDHVRPGEDDGYTLLRVDERMFSADGLIARANGRIERVPLVVRYTHPSFFFQKVAFFPS